MEAAGFMNEHTAEYVLVPDLIGRWGHTDTQAVPFHFWHSREGQAKTRDSYEGPVRVVVAYARRPKVRFVDDFQIIVKFNRVLFEHASILRNEGIPVLAGVPCVASLRAHQLGALCAWFYINPDSEFNGDVFGTVHTGDGNGVGVLPSREQIEGPLDTPTLLRIVDRHARPMLWPEMLPTIGRSNTRLWKEWGYAPGQFGRHPPYKPFYLCLIDDLGATRPAARAVG